MSRLRNWFITINNYTVDDVMLLQSIPSRNDFRYFVWCYEIGKKEETPHIHCYVEFTSSVRFNALKVIVPRGNLQGRHGTRVSVRDYCMKDGNYVEYGEWHENGARTDLEEVHVALDEGRSLRYISEEHFGPFVRYHKSFTTYQALHAPRELRFLEVQVLIGPPGSGKTRQAYEENPDSYWLTQSANGVWFDGYDGQQCLIIDDYDGWIPYTYLLRILDIYPLRCEVKGGFTCARWKKVVLTSEVEVSQWYPDRDTDSLNRRITNFGRKS